MSDFSKHLRAAETALNERRYDDARDACLILIKEQPGLAQGYFLLGMAEAERGALLPAIASVQKAIGLEARADYFAHLARLLVTLRRDEEASAAAERAIALNPATALTLDTIGCVFSRLGAHEKATPLFEQAVAKRPRQTDYRFNLASSLGFLGRFAEAEAQYEALIALDPLFVKAHVALSSLRTQTAEHNHVPRLEALLSARSDPAEQLHLRYALAKEYEDLKDHESAFHHLDTANRRRKAELGYSIDFDRRIFEQLLESFAQPDYFQGASEVRDAPIFIIGLPRTGTTLVDRILSSHAEVESAGELQIMPWAVKRLAGTRSRFTLDAPTIEAAARLQPDALGKLYVSATLPHRNTTKRFIDKLPLNFLYVGFIARALPNARIVCLRRDPLDSVWSNYKHLFATHFSYYNYSYDLHDTATYYSLFDRLMAFWRQTLPGRVLEVQYEDLVDDLEGETRRLLGHCGLDWSDACLRFYENAGAVATPSAAQVRQPIYRSSMGRWRAYARQLEPVRLQLQADGVLTKRVSAPPSLES